MNSFMNQEKILSDTGSDNRTSPWPDYVAGMYDSTDLVDNYYIVR